MILTIVIIAAIAALAIGFIVGGAKPAGWVALGLLVLAVVLMLFPALR